MPGGEAMTRGSPDTFLESYDPVDTPAISESELRNEWRKLVLGLRERRYEADISERHSEEPVIRAVRLTFSHPESFSISTKPVSRRNDIRHHLRGHFADLFNDEANAREFKGARPDIDRMLKACELAYLYDSVYRFLPESDIEPKIDGLESVRFVNLPGELATWMGEVDTVWMVLVGELAPEEPLDEMVDRLYAERETFVEKVKELEIFLPLRSEYLETPDVISKKIEKRLRRGAEISSKDVHDYCFTRAVDQF